MKRHSAIILSSVLALAGTTATAQQPVRAHADIKGEGITGTVDLVEVEQGTGKIVNITLEVTGLEQLSRLLTMVSAMPGVFAARRR